jgi:acyl carrier protein
MNKIDVREAVLEIIAEIAPDADLKTLDDSASLKDQIDLDSMDFLDLVMELRKRHHVEVPKQDYVYLNTLESCVTYLLPKFSQLAA